MIMIQKTQKEKETDVRYIKSLISQNDKKGKNTRRVLANIFADSDYSVSER